MANMLNILKKNHLIVTPAAVTKDTKFWEIGREMVQYLHLLVEDQNTVSLQKSLN